MKFKITYGSINPPDEEIIEAANREQAVNYAYEAACEDYEGYAGLHGLRDTTQIMEEDGVDEDEAYEIFCEERESWLDYSAEEVK